ncbi:MAG: isochorismate synthase [Mycobacteriaceae bacterium]|uniref:isochorismate synthase n=1 Tax=Corynebacterium sp. TaxID=1720 RepID=UPI003F9C87B2
MEEQASADRRFDFATPEYRMSARGVRHVISPGDWTPDAVAGTVQRTLEDAGTGAVVVGCIPFDTTRPASLYVPEEVTWTSRDLSMEQDVDVAPEPVELPEAPEAPGFRDAVGEAVRRIGTGELTKVVLGRTAELNAPDDFDLDRVLAALAAENPRAFIYRSDLGATGDGDASSMLGASPELVLRSRHNMVTSLPLAGSVPRPAAADADGGGGTRWSDAELTAGLRRSPKDLAEHAHVVKQVGEVFRRHTREVVVPEQPGIVATPVILHLASRITGRFPGAGTPADVMKLLYDLHPTPAVCGWPTSVARGVIGELEDFDRGMHAGLVGWVDGSGAAEWALALRGGLVSGPRATMFAGAGIVAGSDPDKEHAETAAKFRTFSSAAASQLRRYAEART